MEDHRAAAQVAARYQQQVEELCAASIRALSGERDLHFRARRLHRGRTLLPVFGPHLQPRLEEDDFGSFRGTADAIALRLNHSDAALHARLCPADPVERWVFELLEQFRAEAQARADMPGVVRNLRHRFEQWSLAFHHSGLTDTVKGLQLYTVAQITRSRVTGQPVIEATEDRIEGTRMKLAPVLGHALAGLRRERFDQAAYAVHALAIARTVGELIRRADPSAQAEDEKPKNEDAADAADRAFSLLLDFDGAIDDGIASVESRDSRVLGESAHGYRAYTTAYDQELRAGSQVRAALLLEYRERLDKRIAAQGLNITRLARQLKALLAVPAHDGWDDGQEEGRIDGRRLAQLISSPAERRLFRTEHPEPSADAQVSFLIDCSGSMKQHAETVAMLVDVFVRALEQAGVASEVLGFTTGAWHGGRAARDWQREGKPRHPGRLNEVTHLVFKDADTPWRRARRDIAALLKADLFREGVDGEAVDWACERLLSRNAEQRLLVVISDGCPMDGATGLANDDYYLDHHLREVVARREQQGAVQIFGVGVGLDLSPFYSRCTALDLSGPIGNEAVFEIVQLLAGRRRR
jgi:cobaltochelatase CobT